MTSSITELAIAINHFDMALNQTTKNMGLEKAIVEPFYSSADDGVAKLCVSIADIEPYQVDRCVQVAIALIALNEKLSDRLRGMTAEKVENYYFFQY